MGELIDDDVLHAFAVIGTPRDAGAELKRRYGDIVDRVTVPNSGGIPPEHLRALLAGLG
jgi:hypothetical protein